MSNNKAKRSLSRDSVPGLSGTAADELPFTACPWFEKVGV